MAALFILWVYCFLLFCFINCTKHQSILFDSNHSKVVVAAMDAIESSVATDTFNKSYYLESNQFLSCYRNKTMAICYVSSIFLTEEERREQNSLENEALKTEDRHFLQHKENLAFCIEDGRCWVGKECFSQSRAENKKDKKTEEVNGNENLVKTQICDERNMRRVLKQLQQQFSVKEVCINGLHSSEESNGIICNSHETDFNCANENERLLKESTISINFSKIRTVPTEYTVDVIAKEPDLKALTNFIDKSRIFHGNNFMKRIAMTVFAPIDSVYEETYLLEQFQEKLYKLSDFESIATHILMRHVVIARLIPPHLITYAKPLSVKSKAGEFINLTRTHNSTDFRDIRVNNAKVVEVIKTKRGYLYKIDKIMDCEWNEGPTFFEYFKNTPGFTKMFQLVNSLPVLTGSAEKIGPITIFAIPDDSWILPNGFAIPECVNTAISRPENRDLLEHIFESLTVPGKWNISSIVQQNSLHVFSNLSDISVTRSISETADLSVFVEGSQIIEWNIPIFNGWLHLVKSVPTNRDINLLPAILWDCLNEFCMNCPKKGEIALQYLDKFGVLPGLDADTYGAPPSIRPNWVCRTTEHWFPVGSTPREYKKYLQSIIRSDGTFLDLNSHKRQVSDAEFQHRLHLGKAEILKRYEEISQKSYASASRRNKVETLARKQQLLLSFMERYMARFNTITDCFLPVHRPSIA